MKKREIICALSLAAVLPWTGAAAVSAEEITGEIQTVAADSAGEAAAGSVNEAVPDEGSVIIEEPGASPEDAALSGDEAQEGENAPEGGILSIELVVEEQTVVDDPGMVDSRKIAENVEDLAKKQKESLIPRLFRSDIAYNAPEVMRTVYSYLTNELGFNHAAACGILANIQYESGSNPGAVGDGGTSFGLCQWHNGRCRSLISYCLGSNVPMNSVDSQLAYLNCELSGEFQGVRDYLYKVPDTAQGAYDAASVWCRHFEMPLHKELEALKRGEFAANVLFWTDLSALTQEDLNAMEEAGDENPLLMTEGQADGLEIVYAAVISSAMEEGGAQLIQDVKDCCTFVDDVVQTGKEVYSYLEDKFYVPEETLAEGIKDIVTEGYSQYEQLLSR